MDQVGATYVSEHSMHVPDVPSMEASGKRRSALPASVRVCVYCATRVAYPALPYPIITLTLAPTLTLTLPLPYPYPNPTLPILPYPTLTLTLTLPCMHAPASSHRGSASSALEACCQRCQKVKLCDAWTWVTVTGSAP